MNLAKRTIIFLILLGIAFWLPGSVISSALACSCARRPTDVAMKKSDAVFSGRVIKIEYLDDPKQRSPEPRFVVTFKIGRSWKGVDSREFTLHTIDNSWTCSGYYFRQDQEYLVFAHQNRSEDAERFGPHKLPEKSFGVSLCGGTKLISEAKDDLQVLGKVAFRRGRSRYIAMKTESERRMRKKPPFILSVLSHGCRL